MRRVSKTRTVAVGTFQATTRIWPSFAGEKWLWPCLEKEKCVDLSPTEACLVLIQKKVLR